MSKPIMQKIIMHLKENLAFNVIKIVLSERDTKKV